MVSNDLFFEKKKRELGVSLNNIQKEAVLNNQGPLLLLASPGSGKTTTLIMKIGYLIEVMGVSPSKIKAVTFSRASAKDMEERFKRFFPNLPMIDFSTIHSLAFQVVREQFYKQKIDYQIIEGNNNFEGQNNNVNPYIYKKKIIRDIYKLVNGEVATEDQLEELMTIISYIKNKLLPETKWNSVLSKIPKKELIIKKYEDYKKFGTGRLLLDFDDMLTIANEIFDKDKVVLSRYQKMYDYVLTDESQDTSMVQHSIIQKLVEKHNNLCVVADEDQSIYSWRGAEPQYLLDFKIIYPNANVLMMLHNYRSSRNIVDIANKFIKQNKKRYDKNMYTENPAYKSIQFKSLSDYKLQSNYLVDQVSKIDKLHEVAVLYRNNSSPILLIEAFDKANIPFYMKDTDNRFFNHWVVQDILNFMRLSYNFKRIDIFEKIYSKFQGYVSSKQFAELKQVQNNQSVFDNLISFVKLEDYQVKLIQKFKESYNKMKTASPKSIIKIIRRELGYESSLDFVSKKKGYNYEYLIEILDTLESISESTNSMVEFAQRLDHLDLLMKSSSYNKGENAVTFSTFHSSKGLEFETVYMIDLIEGIIPSKSKVEKSEEYIEVIEEEKEEEVRLFYVGMTRAKYNLELITYSKRFNKNVNRSEFFKQVETLVNPIEKRQQKMIRNYTRFESKNNQPNKSNKTNNPNAIKESSSLRVGMNVKHLVFGAGEVISYGSEVLEIRFQNEIKKFQISACLKHGFLEKMD